MTERKAEAPAARGREPQSDLARDVLAALYRAGARARRRAAAVGGPVVIVEDGEVKYVSPDDPRFPRCEPLGRDLQPRF